MWKKQLKKGLKIDEFELIEELGSGTSGVVWKVKNTQTKQNVALKIGEISGTLFHEAHVRRKIGEVEGLYTILTQEKANYDLGIKYFSMPLYEQTLKEYYQENEEKFTNKYIFKLICKIIVILYDIHDKNYVFRDLSLQNLMCLDKKWYLIDIGAALPIGHPTGFTGTPAYGSINALMGNPPNPKDDLESLGYIMLYLINKSLPWMDGTKPKTTAKYYKTLAETRKQQTLDLLEEIDDLKLSKFFETLYSSKSNLDTIYQDLIDILQN
jgi:serine/threonine protein kinase